MKFCFPALLFGLLLAGCGGTSIGYGQVAQFSPRLGVATDAANNVYVANQNSIRRITPGGAVSTLAGSADVAGSSDGVGAVARFDGPSGIAVDSMGNVYVADEGNNTIRRITLNGLVTTVAGIAGSSGAEDGAGSVARFSSPTGVAIDRAGNLYVADRGNNTIRKITATGMVSTLAGLPGEPGSADGVGSAARFSQPSGIALDSAGNLYVADRDNDTIRKLAQGGAVTTFAGRPGIAGSADGIGAASSFSHPSGIAVDGAMNVYVADQGNSTLREITPAGAVSTLVGVAGIAGNANGVGGAAANFFHPSDVAVDSAGNLFVADQGDGTIREISPVNVSQSGAASSLQVDTSIVQAVMNLDARTAVPVSPFDAGNPASYNYAVSVTLYDSLAKAHRLQTYYVYRGQQGDQANADTAWQVFATIDGVAVSGTGGAIATGAPTGVLSFAPNGALDLLASTSPLTLTLNVAGAAAKPMVVKLDYAGTTQYGAVFQVSSLAALLQTVSTTNLQINPANLAPSETSSVQQSVNLDARDLPRADAGFNAADPTSYNNSTSVTLNDSVGDTHLLQCFYLFAGTNNSAAGMESVWHVYATVDSKAVSGGISGMPVGTLAFTRDGTLDVAASTIPILLSLTVAIGDGTAWNVSVDFTGTTQNPAPFSETVIRAIGKRQ